MSGADHVVQYFHDFEQRHIENLDAHIVPHPNLMPGILCGIMGSPTGLTLACFTRAREGEELTTNLNMKFFADVTEVQPRGDSVSMDVVIKAIRSMSHFLAQFLGDHYYVLGCHMAEKF